MSRVDATYSGPFVNQMLLLSSRFESFGFDSALTACGEMLSEIREKTRTIRSRPIPTRSQSSWPKFLQDFHATPVLFHLYQASSSGGHGDSWCELGAIVRREPCAEDRRGAWCVITPAGRALRKRMWPVYEALVNACFGDLITREEAMVMAGALEKVRRHLRGDGQP
jgi:hypothetical protein